MRGPGKCDRSRPFTFLAERTLRLDSSNWGPFLDLLRDGVVVRDGDGRVAALNEAAARLIGLPAGATAVGERLDAVLAAPAALADGYEGPAQAGAARRDVHVVCRRLPFGGDAPVDVLIVRERAGATGTDWSLHLAGLSHDLRTPLGVVLGLAELALSPDGVPAADRARLRSAMRRNGEQLLRLTDDVLDVALAERRGLKASERTFAPASFLESLVVSHAAAAETKGLALASELEPGLPAVLTADHVRFLRVANNIVANAIKYTENGSVRLILGVRRAAGAIEAVRLVVADTGIGIDARRRATVFQPFERGEAPAGRPGHGLGLFLARNVARAIGGDVAVVESEPGLGSAFEVVVPAREV